MADTGKYYFASDLHLGLPDPDGKRERLFVDFLNGLPADAKGLFLLGDIFDFWVDYKDVVPRGGVRALAAIAAVAERMPVWYFRGNHDWWVTDYFEKELGVRLVKEPYVVMERCIPAGSSVLRTIGRPIAGNVIPTGPSR